MVDFRIMMGHNCLAEHLHYMGITASPDCVLCKRAYQCVLTTLKSVLLLENFGMGRMDRFIGKPED